MAASPSVTELWSKALIYPSVLQDTIPLWMKFYCYEYTNNALGRVIAQNVANGGGSIEFGDELFPTGNPMIPLIPVPGIGSKEKAQIFLPAPVNFQTNTSHRYEAAPLKATNILPNYFGAAFNLLLDQLPQNIRENIKNADEIVNNILGVAESALGNLTGFESELIGLEYKDSTFVDIGPSRTYEMRFNLPCLTVADSQKAGTIIRAFEALSLPTARSALSLSTTKAFHPPLWVFGIGPINQRKYDIDWTGMPQISVLRNVSHKKTAFETNALASLGIGNILKPVCYTLTLSFVELEPAFRAITPGRETSLQIVNRSTVIATTGMSGVFAK